MSRTLTILCIIGVLCFLGIWVAYRLYIANLNARRTEKARQASVEAKQARKSKPEPESEQKQTELFGSDDVKELQNDAN